MITDIMPLNISISYSFYSLLLKFGIYIIHF